MEKSKYLQVSTCRYFSFYKKRQKEAGSFCRLVYSSSVMQKPIGAMLSQLGATAARPLP